LSVWERVSVALGISGIVIQKSYDFYIPSVFNTFRSFVTLAYRMRTLDDIVVN